MNRLTTEPDTTPTNLFNPSLESFTLIYDKKEYTISAYAVEPFPKYIADRVASSLADTIIGKRGVIKNRDLDRKELLEEIYMK